MVIVYGQKLNTKKSPNTKLIFTKYQRTMLPDRVVA